MTDAIMTRNNGSSKWKNPGRIALRGLYVLVRSDLHGYFLSVIVYCPDAVLTDNADVELPALQHARELTAGSTYREFP